MTLVIPSIETHACVREGFQATGDGGFTGKELHEVYWRPIGQSTPLDFADVWQQAEDKSEGKRHHACTFAKRISRYEIGC